MLSFCQFLLHIEVKYLWVISGNFDLTDQSLLIYPAFVKCFRKRGIQ